MQCQTTNQPVAHTVTAQTLTPTSGAGSVEAADKKDHTGPEYWMASSKRWLIRAFLHDLSEYAAGDVRRFERMVDGRGNKMSSPESYRANIAECLAWPGLDGFFPELRAEAETKLAGMKL